MKHSYPLKPTFFHEPYLQFRLGRIWFILMDRIADLDDPFLDYVSWCHDSETFFFWWWELHIMYRRKRLSQVDQDD